MNNPNVRHGRRQYIYGCRCDVCVESNRLYQREYLRRRVKAGVVDSHGKVKVPNVRFSDSPSDGADNHKTSTESQSVVSLGRQCDCALCQRGHRYYKNTESLPQDERDWMRGLYDAVLDEECEREMQADTDAGTKTL